MPPAGIPRTPVYLIDLHCFQPPPEYKVDGVAALDCYERDKTWDPATVTFMRRILDRSGLDPHGTYLPHRINPQHTPGRPNPSVDDTMLEVRLCLFGAFQGLLDRTGLHPTDIDILVTTCSVFCPTPSMASLIVNRFKLRRDVQSYHLGGMGCSNGVVAMNLVRDLLHAHPNSNAVLITHEATTPAFYPGEERSRLVSNILFRMGSAAVLLSNRPAMRPAAKYRLRCAFRIHSGADDAAFLAIQRACDEQGIVGVRLDKELVTEATRAVTVALTKAGPHVLPWSELLMYVVGEVKRKLGGKGTPRYTPSFAGSAEHFLLHAGGAKVLDGLGQGLGLDEAALAPSRMVLRDYGNVSASSTWYTMAYIESCCGVEAGDRVLQVGVGSGIKCGVNQWQALRDIADVHTCWQQRASEVIAKGASPRLQRLRKRCSSAGSWATADAIIALILALLIAVASLVVQLKVLR